MEEGPKEMDILVYEIDSVEMEDDEGRSDEERVAQLNVNGFQKAKRQLYDYSLLISYFIYHLKCSVPSSYEQISIGRGLERECACDHRDPLQRFKHAI